jgi:hypothetical protein
MTMKKLLYIFLLVLPVLFSVVSCDVIEPPYTTGSTGTDTGTAVVKQKVLVEYFTGHRCVNCPTESFLLKQIWQQYGDRMIFISVHAGFFAVPLVPGNYTTDLRCQTGNELDAVFGVTAISTPNALVNRKEYEGNLVLPSFSWAGAVAEEMMRLPVAGIYIEPNLQGNNLQLNAGVKPIMQIDGTYMISAYIVEDSIVSYQKNGDPFIGPTPDIPDYVHRYVLRGSLNGTFGDTIFSPVAMPGDSLTKQMTAAINPSWNVAQLYVIVFIYNRETEEVLQVQMKKVQ